MELEGGWQKGSVWPDWPIFESYWWQVFLQNIAKIFADVLDYFEKGHFLTLTKIFYVYYSSNFYKHLGYFSVQHLVTLKRSKSFSYWNKFEIFKSMLWSRFANCSHSQCKQDWNLAAAVASQNQKSVMENKITLISGRFTALGYGTLSHRVFTSFKSFFVATKRTILSCSIFRVWFFVFGKCKKEESELHDTICKLDSWSMWPDWAILKDLCYKFSLKRSPNISLLFGPFWKMGLFNFKLQWSLFG